MTTKKMLSQGKFKEMEENEIIVDNKEAAEGIYKSLGLVLKQSIQKFRESYKLKDGLVEIDINDKRYHHEIYLSDPRRCDVSKLKTVIRHPIK